MESSSSNQRYTDVAIALHWLLALAWVGAFCVGFYMADLKLSPTRIRLFNWHKWAGISILLLSAFRLAWRLTHQPPPEPASLGALQRAVAEWTHRVLYVFFFLVPLAGWAYSSAAGFQVVWFGVLPLPNLVPTDKALAEVLKQVHGALAYGIAAVAALHAAAALHHRFILRDGILARMLPQRRN